MRTEALVVAVVFAIGGLCASHGDPADDAEALFDEATGHLMDGEYRQAVSIYDDILEALPNNVVTLKMKGVAQSNLGYHEKSLEQFFRVLQLEPNDIHALAGMGVGFGYLGEYQEAKKYFEKAARIKPESTIIQNYDQYVAKVIAKYPYTPTEKPRQLLEQESTHVPGWVRETARAWTEGLLSDRGFLDAVEFLIGSGVIQTQAAGSHTAHGIPPWVRESANAWVGGAADDKTFAAAIEFLVEGGVVSAGQTGGKTQEELDSELFYFKQYLRRISNDIAQERRYIEFPNPSQDVIKKFMRDYVKWNFEEEVKMASSKFPDPAYEIAGDTIVLKYRIYVNEQPTGLPLDHVGTLKRSMEYWESERLSASNKKLRVEFEITDSRHDANVWVTWVVRDIGEGVLGHAHLGKGVVEVTLGDYSCDGSFQLYDVESVEQIMRHELGHSIGLQHTDDRDSIMYPSYRPGYAYCLLG